MAEPKLEYRQLAERALLGVVREALALTARAGLPGEHHFYLTFRTDFPGVGLSSALKARYPSQMTIVLQNQFWNLSVGDTGFSVRLSFDGKVEQLTIPFASLTSFTDPHAKFGLRFEPRADESAAASAAVPASAKMGTDAPPEGENAGCATVVTLDAFRKKQ